MHPRTFGAFLVVLTFGATNAADKCASNVLVKAFEGLNVNTFLVSCMTQNNFSAALDGSVDLTAEDAASAPEQVKTICASDSCTTILSTLVGSVNFNLTNCIVGDDLVLMTEISNLQTTCTALSAPSKPKDKEGAPIEATTDAFTDAPTDAPVPDIPPTTTMTEPAPTNDSTPTLTAPNNSPEATLATPPVVPTAPAEVPAPLPPAPVVLAPSPVVPAPAPAIPAKEAAPAILTSVDENVDQESEEELKKQKVVVNPVSGSVGDHPPSTYCEH
uniref:Elicitin-like protein n=1 Tax=Hyaloperonospora arabidopsidis (strain Emoy2) TaxID=559515 RepID=M4BWN2_HYAAE